MQRSIPCVLMRGGTSRGPYLLGEDLPADPQRRDAVLIALMAARTRCRSTAWAAVIRSPARWPSCRGRRARAATWTTSLRRWRSIAPASIPSRTAATCLPGWAPSRSRPAWSKRAIPKRSCGSTTSTPAHGSAALLAHIAGVKARHVAYRGASPALNDLVDGHLHFMVTTIPSATGLIEGKSLTALAVTGEKRAPALPEVPTAIEAGLPGYTASAWYGLLAPKGLPADIRQTLEAAAAQALKDPEMIARLKDDGAVPADMPSAKFGEFMARERTRWGEIVKAANITIE